MGGSARAFGVGGRHLRNPRTAAVAFGLCVASVVPVVAFWRDDGRWFWLDDWAFITDRQLDSVDGILAPHNGHWVSVPVIAYRLVYGLFGIRSYLPYRMLALAGHVAVVVLLRVLVRRVGVGPWLATCAVAPLVLFGPGSDNIVSAFQITFTAGLAFALAQLLLADHAGRSARRDAAALGCGLLAVMSSAVAIPVIAATGVALLVRRGWRAAAVQVVPLVGIYLLWSAGFPASDQPRLLGPASLSVTLSWVRRATAASFGALGHFRLVAVLLAALLVTGTVLALTRPHGPGRPFAAPGVEERMRSGWLGSLQSRLAPIIVPLSLVMALAAFVVLVARERWVIGDPRSSRYVYVYAVLLVPALAVAAQAVVHQWRRLAIPVVALLVVAVPHNATTGFDPFPGNANHRVALTTIVRIPEARQVPPDVRPLPVRRGPVSPTIGFLLHARRTGKLEPTTAPISPKDRNTYRLRLGLAQREAGPNPYGCLGTVGTAPMTYPVGTQFFLSGPVRAVLRADTGQEISGGVGYDTLNGNWLTIELPQLRIAFSPSAAAALHRC